MADRSGRDQQAKPPLSPAEAAKRAAAAKRAETARRAAAAKRPTGRPRTRDQRIARRIKIGGAVLVAVLAIVVVWVVNAGGDVSNDASGTAVPGPEPTERADTVVLLRNAHRTQEICYGWELLGGTQKVSVGSNLGVSVALGTDPSQCSRWVKVIADVTYTEESSESEDWASFWVTSSDDLSGIDYVEGLSRLGLTDDDFLADPGWAICRAAVFLPLLVAESDAVPAAPVPTSGAGPSPSPSPQATLAALPDPGSDFWRDRSFQAIGAGFLFLISVLLLAVGWFERRHQRGGTKPKKPSDGTGTGTGNGTGNGNGNGTGTVAGPSGRQR
ncbi:hypothetical protein OG792_32560 [Micromonospora sp. NBC_01699]|uniref:hypothetical protein n=1 Tax=Micromonospora sp. NBC_01699 TaxID=2975984 RepID=UPI002E2CD90E|nr:hypothetical protein [Micromonospora sp. NBC_01699]